MGFLKRDDIVTVFFLGDDLQGSRGSTQPNPEACSASALHQQRGHAAHMQIFGPSSLRISNAYEILWIVEMLLWCVEEGLSAASVTDPAAGLRYHPQISNALDLCMDSPR